MALLLLLYRLGAKDFWDASEARPAQSAREMRAQGDWLVPYTNGAVDLTKPPVYAWLAGASFAALGESEAAARLPSVLATLAALAVAFAVGRRVGGDRAGTLAAFACLTQVRFLWQARLAEIETLLCLAVACAYASLLRVLEASSPRERAWAGAGFFVSLAAGLAVKGPVVFLLTVPGAVAAAAWTGRARALASPAFLSTAPLCLLGLSWYAAVVLREPSHAATFLAYARGENVGHLRGPFYYLLQYPLNALPWTPVVALGLALPFARGLDPRTRDRLRVLVACFAAAFLAMSAVPAKQTHYLMPVFWVGGVLAGVAFDRVLRAGRPRVRWAALALGAALVLVEARGVGQVAPSRNGEMSSRRFLERVAARTADGDLAWTVFGSHSDYLWHLPPERVGTRGVPELVGPTEAATLARVRGYLAAPGPRYALVTGAQADALAGAGGATVLLRDDAFQKKRRSVALVARPGDPPP